MDDYYVLFVFAISWFFLLLVVKTILREFRSRYFVKNFTTYHGILKYYMDKAFELIYKDRILVYSLEGTKLSEEEVNKTSRDFIQLVLKFIGPKVTSELVYFFGDIDTLLFNIVDYFNTRYEEDSIREESLNSLSESAGES